MQTWLNIFRDCQKNEKPIKSNQQKGHVQHSNPCLDYLDRFQITSKIIFSYMTVNIYIHMWKISPVKVDIRNSNQTEAHSTSHLHPV